MKMWHIFSIHKFCAKFIEILTIFVIIMSLGNNLIAIVYNSNMQRIKKGPENVFNENFFENLGNIKILKN